jgi:hypothetical protein
MWIQWGNHASQPSHSSRASRVTHQTQCCLASQRAEFGRPLAFIFDQWLLESFPSVPANPATPLNGG